MDNLDHIFETMKKNRWVMSQTSAADRIKKLIKLKEVIQRRRLEISDALYADFKKPFAESELTEIHMAIDEINFTIKKLSGWMKPKKVKSPLVLLGSRSYIRSEAKGVVLVLAPWNYPFQLLINPLVAAVSAGNCVIARPSEKTPATALIIKTIIEEVYPENMVKIVIGEVDQAEKLLTFPFDHIFFTGSTQVGKIVMAAAAKHLTPVTLELGGKSPVIIDRDVNLQDAAEKIVWGKFMNGGQTCVAPDYVFVPEEMKDEFVEHFREQLEKSYGDTSLLRLKTPDFARIIDTKGLDRLALKIKNEKTLLGDAVQRDDRFMPPTLLTDVDLKSPIMEDEIFGPILPLFTYKDLAVPLNYIKMNPKPLALYIFSRSKKTIKAILSETTAGGTAINHVVLHLANPYLPFGGVGTSGMGSYHGEFGFKTFSHERAVLHQGRLNLSRYYFPPYDTFMSKMAFKFLKWLE